MNVSIKQILENKDLTNAFLLDNKKFVRNILNRTYPSIINTYDEEDYIQEGLLGLYKAMLHFDKGKGVKFNTFAFRVIQGEIIRKFKSQNIKIHQYNNIMSVSSLNEEIESQYDNSVLEIINTLVDDINLENTVIDKCFTEDLLRKLNLNILPNLKQDYKEILSDLLHNKTQADIARTKNCSKENIRKKVSKIREIIQRENLLVGIYA